MEGKLQFLKTDVEMLNTSLDDKVAMAVEKPRTHLKKANRILNSLEPQSARIEMQISGRALTWNETKLSELC